VQEKACQLFTEVENQGVELEQVVSTAEQHLEGPVSDALIQEFTEQEVSHTTASRSSSSQARGIRGRIAQTRVTRDESQVSVGGLLALDQVLKLLGHI
jgi:cation transport ATPase